MPKYNSPIFIIETPILKPYTVTGFEKVYAYNHNADGFYSITVNIPAYPLVLKSYLEGDDSVTLLPIASNVSKLCNYALASYKNLVTIYLFKNDEIVELEEYALAGLDFLEHIYVPEELYDAYCSAYPAYASLFTKIITTNEFVIPESDTNVLTKELMNEFIGMLSPQKINAIERIVISNYDTIDDEALTGLNVFINCHELVFENVTTGGTDILKGVTNIKYIDVKNTTFELQGICDSTNVANFKWLVPYQNVYSYIYKQYIKDYYVTGYVSLSSGNSMPDRMTEGYWKWFNDKQTREEDYLGDTDTYKTATYSGRYYAFIVIDTLVISGSGTLTSAIFKNAIDSVDTDISPLENISKIIVSSGFTSGESGCFYNDERLTNNNITVEMTMNINPTILFSNDDNQIYKNLIIHHSDNYNIPASYCFDSRFTNITIYGSIGVNNSYFYSYSSQYVNPLNVVFYSNGAFASQYTGYRTTNSRLYLPNISSFNDDRVHIIRVYFSSEWQGNAHVYQTGVNKKYSYMGAKLNNTNKLSFIGILDGANVYTDKGFNYPKLSATLTLDTSNGHLMENGADLFTDRYTATWYSDENCTQVINDLTTITESTTAYVKLTEINYQEGDTVTLVESSSVTKTNIVLEVA